MPRIEEWLVSPGLYGVTHISGNVYGHTNPRHPDGKRITTTPIVSVDREKKTFKTHSGSEYELGVPKQDQFRDPFDGGKTDAIDFLVKRVESFLDGQQYLFRLKADKVIQLPTVGEYPLYTDDVFVKSEKGGYTKLTGICICDLPINDDEVEHWDRIVCLGMM